MTKPGQILRFLKNFLFYFQNLTFLGQVFSFFKGIVQGVFPAINHKGVFLLEKSKKLSRRERLFCRFYCATGNAREAAVRSGYQRAPEEKGLELLADDSIIAEIKRGMERERELAKVKALKGLERIAFGSIADAARLVCSDSPPLLCLDGLDLFLISEIKKPKDGAMEIKFFDRLKALERLMQEGEQDSSSALPLYNALREASRTISGGETDEL